MGTCKREPISNSEVSYTNPGFDHSAAVAVTCEKDVGMGLCMLHFPTPYLEEVRQAT